MAWIDTDGAVCRAVEYADEAVRAPSIERHLTLCNLSIEADARTGIGAPDATTIEFLCGPPCVVAFASRDAVARPWAAPVAI